MKRVALIAGVLLLVGGIATAVVVYRWPGNRKTDEPAAGGVALSAWLEKLREPDPRVGAEAVDRLASLGHDGMEVLLAARKDSDLRAHRRAVAGLLRFGPEAAGPLATALLRDGSRAEVALVRLGAAAVPALEEALGKPGGQHVARVLGSLEQTARPAVPALISVVQDGGARAEARAMAAWALGQIGLEPREVPLPGGDPILGALTAALSGPPAVRLQAIRAIEYIGPPARSTVRDLIRLTKDSETEIAVAACRALGAMQVPDGAAALGERVRKKDGASGEAAQALAALGPAARPGIPALIGGLKTAKKPGEPTTEVFTLVRLGTAALSDLQTALRDTTPEIRRSAAEVLGLMGPRAFEAVPDLLRCLNDKEPAVVLAVAQAVGRIAPGSANEAVAALVRLFDHKDPSTAESASAILAGFGPAGRVVASSMLSGLRSKDEGAVRRAARVLGGIRTTAPGPVAGLREALSGPRGARPHCIVALGLLGPAAKDAIGDLQKALRDENLRPYAADALVRISPDQLADVVRVLHDDLAGARDLPRQRALGVLLGFETIPDTLAHSLRPLFNDNNPGIATAALMLADRLSVAEREKLLPDLMTQLSATDVKRREAAGRLLRRMPEKALPGLRQALSSGSSRMRLGALWTLRGRGFAPVASDPAALLACLKEKDPAVRSEAAEVLAEHGAKTEAAIEQAVALLASPESDLRRVMVRALAGVGPEQRERIVPDLVECLLDPDGAVRHGAAWALGRFGQAAKAEKPLAALRAALADSSTSVRHMAAESLWGLEGEKARAEVVPVLAHLARTETPRARFELLDLLFRADPREARKLAAQVEIDTRGGDVSERVEAGVWLVKLAPEKAEEVTALFVGMLAGWADPVPYFAVTGLEQLGPKARNALPALRRRLEVTDHREMRSAIQRAVKAIGE